MVDVIIAYVSGTEGILAATLESIKRHPAGIRHRIRIVTDIRDKTAPKEILSAIPRGGLSASIYSYDIGNPSTGSGQHARLLDRSILDGEEEFILTLDSDCFPVSDNWMVSMVDRLDEDGVATSGILWPWIPPDEGRVSKTSIDWKIRSQHCWNNTQPACQMIRRELVVKMGLKFADATECDTNCGIMSKVHDAGMKCVGWMPTRGPIPDVAGFDPELNRHESIIFGDMMYHHVGASRERAGLIDPSNIFKSARERVYAEKGAEWMMLPGNSHAFKMDREEEVAAFKMKMVYDIARTVLETKPCLFGDDWV